MINKFFQSYSTLRSSFTKNIWHRSTISGGIFDAKRSDDLLTLRCTIQLSPRSKVFCTRRNLWLKTSKSCTYKLLSSTTRYDKCEPEFLGNPRYRCTACMCTIMGGCRSRFNPRSASGGLNSRERALFICTFLVETLRQFSNELYLRCGGSAPLLRYPDIIRGVVARSSGVRAVPRSRRVGPRLGEHRERERGRKKALRCLDAWDGPR